MKKLLLAAAMLVLASAGAAQAGNALSRAAIAGDMTAVQARVKAGEDVNDIDKWGWTALHWAVYYGNSTVVQWLLEQNADPNEKTKEEYGPFLPGTTPLIMAAYYGHNEITAALVKKDADASVVDRKGKKAIDYAKEYSFDKVVALLENK